MLSEVRPLVFFTGAERKENFFPDGMIAERRLPFNSGRIWEDTLWKEPAKVGNAEGCAGNHFLKDVLQPASLPCL